MPYHLVRSCKLTIIGGLSDTWYYNVSVSADSGFILAAGQHEPCIQHWLYFESVET